MDLNPNKNPIVFFENRDMVTKSNNMSSSWIQNGLQKLIHVASRQRLFAKPRQGCKDGFGATGKPRNESWQNVRYEGCYGGHPSKFKVVFADSHRQLYATEDARVGADEKWPDADDHKWKLLSPMALAEELVPDNYYLVRSQNAGLIRKQCPCNAHEVSCSTVWQ